ncbi:MAG: hypothetical protein OEM05_06090 [Myxococcales bacterium]|nr:hypothetical protein [Myxococcales bacterium]
MASPKDIAISREFMAAKRAYEISESRLKRLLDAYAKSLPPRRPVGAPRSVVRPPLENRADPISRTDMNLHIHAFVRYVEALRNYYRGRPAEFAAAARKAFNLTALTQHFGREVADKDVSIFLKHLAEERCQKAVRDYRSNSRRSIVELLAALALAQCIPDTSTLPAVQKAQGIANSIF